MLLTLGMMARSYVAGLYGKEEFYNQIIEQECARNGLDVSLVKAVIWKESRFDPKAFGEADERGLMQVTPVAGLEWAHEVGADNFRPVDLYDPKTNIRAGTWYLARAKSRWSHADKPIIFALAEYNAGRTHALRWAKELKTPAAAAFIEKISYPTTKRYILDILEKRQTFIHEKEASLLDLIYYDLASRWGHQAPKAKS